MSALRRLIDFYGIQAHLLWEWRAGRRALLKRGLFSFVIAWISFAVTAWAIPGILVTDVASVAIAVVVIALLYALVQTIFLALVAPISLLLVGVASIVFQVFVIGILGPLVPRVSNGEGLLSRGGVSIGNLVTGEASRSFMTMAALAEGARGIGRPRDFYGFFVSPHNYLRVVFQTVGEIGKELVQARRQARAGIEPRMPRGFPYPIARAVTNILLRGLQTSLIIEEMYRGTPVIYADYTDYDEIAHHSGPERAEAFDALDGVDRTLGALERAAADAARPYRFVVLSDHGQTLGATFQQRYGVTLQDTVHALMGGRASVESATGRVEEWGAVNTFLSEFTRGIGVGPAIARRALRSRTRDGLVELGRRVEAAPPAEPAAEL